MTASNTARILSDSEYPEQSELLIEPKSFGALLESLFRERPPGNDRVFVSLLNETIVDASICNFAFFQKGVKRFLEAVRQADGQFRTVALGQRLSVQGQIDVDVDGDDLNIVVRNLNVSDFVSRYSVRWWSLVDSEYRMDSLKFERKTFDRMESFIARIEGGALQPTLIAIAENEK